MRVLSVEDEPHLVLTIPALRERLGQPWPIATVPGAGRRIDTGG